jgi:hypothetical protein
MTDTAPSFSLIQQESITFNQPSSEASLTAVAGLVNALRTIMLPVGSIVESMLTETQWHSQNNGDASRWVIADGRDVTGSAYQILTSNTTVPDLRGVFRRGKNNGRSTGTGNPDGDLALGTYEADEFSSHNHNYSDPGHFHVFSSNIFLRANAYQAGPSTQGAYDQTGSPQNNIVAATTGITIQTQGGAENRPRNVTVNIFIRIN